MSEMTARYGLPFLVAGQGQKDITHNEALLLIDLLLHPCVESRVVSTPPVNAGTGEAWLVPVGATDEWAGFANSLMAWTDGGWRQLAPREGMPLWVRDENVAYRYVSGQWVAGEG